MNPLKSTPINPTTVIASLVTIASVVFTTWSVFDLTTPTAPALVALAAGAGVELVWLYILATEWQQAGRTGHLSRGLTVTGWVLAAVAAVVITVHGVLTTLALVVLAVLPLAAKAGWHWQTRLRAAATRVRLETEEQAEREVAETARKKAEQDRRAAEEAQRLAQELSADLTEDQQKELAALEREAAYVVAKTEKELALDAAKAKADQERALAEIRRQAEQQMAVDEGSADVQVRRMELANRIRLASPVYTVTELPAGGQHEVAHQVPDDPSGFGVPPVGGPVAGFGAGLSELRAQGGGIGRTPGGTVPDQGEHPSPTVGGGGIGGQGGDIGADQGQRAPHHAARVAAGQGTRQRVLEEIDYAGVQVSTAELSRLLGIGRTTVREHRNALADAGHRVYPDSE